MIKARNKIYICLTLAGCLSGCATLIKPGDVSEEKKLEVQTSYIQTVQASEAEYTENTDLAKIDNNTADFTLIAKPQSKNAQLGLELASNFPEDANLQVSLNAMPLNEFVHYVYGELLRVSYILEASVKGNSTPVTLSLNKKVSAREVFQLSNQILASNNVQIRQSDNVYFISPIPTKGAKSDKAFGFGRNQEDVPLSSGIISQAIPLKYKATKGVQQAIGSLIDARVAVDEEQGLLSVEGTREQILRVLSLVYIFDSKLLYDKYVALLGFKYLDSDSFINKVTELLAEEGITTNYDNLKSNNINFIPLEHLGQVVVFARDREILSRVEYWAKLIDKPAKGSEQSFYIYHPKYARASDLGASLQPLLGAKSSQNSKDSRASELSNVNQQVPSLTNPNPILANKSKQVSSLVQGDGISLVVDERANALIFHSTGKHYQELLPIIRKLDVMPKQIMMEVVIAEVNLTGSFSKGVEFAIKSGAAGKKTESFSFGGDGGFSYSIVGLNGNFNINLNQTDGLINVLSRPTLVVRDGVAASISVGNDIPTVGSTTTDPISGDRETTTIQYRRTGVNLSVTPTINAQGTVIMSISQNISNVSTSGPSIGGSPSVFERKLDTEVVAGDGQTVMLGGLISENNNSSSTAIPILGEIPIFGHLFRTDGRQQDKTELVVLVTPKIVKTDDDWKIIKDSFKKGLENLEF